MVAEKYSNWLVVAFFLMMTSAALAAVRWEEQAAISAFLVMLALIGLKMVSQMELFAATCLALAWSALALLLYGPELSPYGVANVLIGLIAVLAGGVYLYRIFVKNTTY